MARARQTSYLLASTLQHGCPILIEPDFHEIIWHDENGRFQRHEDKGVKNIQHYFDNVDARLAPNLETQRDVYERVTPLLPDLMDEALNKSVYVVAHYFVVKAIRAFIEVGSAEAMANYDPKNVDPIIYTPDVIRDSMARIMEKA